MKKCMVMVVFIIIGTFLVVPDQSPAQQDTLVRLKMAMFMPATAHRAKLTGVLINAINERGKGRLEIQWLGGPEVVPPFEQAMAVRRGAIDMSMLPAAFYEGLVPVGDILLLSRVSVKEERERGAWDLLRSLHEKAGLFFLGRADGKNEPQFYMTLKKSIKSPDELAGLKLGLAGTHAKGFSRALGMGMASMPPSEAYTALERGVVDAFSTAPDAHISYGVYEGVKFAIDHPYFADNTVLIMSLNTWKGLSEINKKLILDTYLEMEPELIKLHREMIAENKQKMEESGIKFIRFSPDDAKRFIDTAYNAEWERVTAQYPDVAPLLKKMFIE